MAIRPPPGRAGRIWLLRRVAVARRGRDVLEQKRRALLRESERLAAQAEEARAEWERAARAAEEWWQRAAVLAGERPLELALGLPRDDAEVRLRWRNALGVVYADDADVRTPPPSATPRGTSALHLAADAHRRALAAAAPAAALGLALERTRAEAQATTRRLRAIERRWIPEHEAALRRLELALDEADREDAARARWISRRRQAK